MSNPSNRRSLRRELREARRSLPPAVRRRASRQACLRLQRLRWFRQARHVALYLPLPEEADPRSLTTVPPAQRFYVPILVSEHGMRFAPLGPNLRHSRNRLGISEPRCALRHSRRPSRIDLAIVPLLGFDRHCNRLGQGGGHYDRAFAFLTHRRLRHGGPRLVGLAFACQQVAAIDKRAWDIPLDAVVTEARVHLR